jgi:hypothetical protein
MPHTVLDFDGTLAHVQSLLGTEASVEVLGRDTGGHGTIAELTGVLRTVGPDPADPEWNERGPRVFGFEGQVNAFYLDPDAFIEAEAWDDYLRVTTTFGALVLAGPLRRPDWF